MTSQVDYQDIITKKPIPIKVLPDKETNSVLYDPNYFPIINVLRKHPMTVKELVEEYNKIAEEEKSDKTIYRYLKSLEEADLVIPVGQRVTIGKTATETLFGRTAILFKPHAYDEEWWCCDSGREMSRKANILVSNALGKKQVPPIEVMVEYLTEFSREESAIIEELSRSDYVTEFFTDEGDFKEVKNLIEYVGLIGTLLKRPDLLEKLRTHYKD